MNQWKKVAGCVVTAAIGGGLLQVIAAGLGYQDTPMLPGGKWHVHDGTRPQPAVVTPGTFSSQDTPGIPPSDAIVLFDGTDISKWERNGKTADWKVENGYMESRGGDIHTKDSFGDCQLHVEFCEPTVVRGSGQGRGNSGVFLMSRFETQVLDSYNNPTYPDGQASAVYGQTPPFVNASRKPGEWQTYDIAFTAPVFKDRKLVTPAYITTFHNGVLVQNHTEIIGPTGHRILANYNDPIPPTAPLGLQFHGDPVRFRNIWIRPLKTREELDAMSGPDAPAAPAQ
jgi:hypothetical protein